MTTKSERGHTPTPWLIETGGWSSGAAQGGMIGAVDPTRGSFHTNDQGEKVFTPSSVTILHFRTDTPEGMANARFAVRAVNSHEALVEALELIEVDLTAGDLTPKQRVALALSRVQAALSLAMGDTNV